MASRSLPDADNVIRVLHIDDEQEQLVFAKLFLEQADPTIRITSTTNHLDVLKNLDLEKFDCLVSDYQMPRMNGIELASKVRQKSNIHIIIYTGQGSEEVAEAAFSVGVDDYVRKEIDPSHYHVLVKRIKNSVEKKRVEHRLKQRELELSWMVENSADAMFKIDLEKGVTRFNPTFRQFFGLIKDTPVPLEELESRIHPDDLKYIKELVSKIYINKSKQITFTHRFLSHRGKTLWFDTNLVALIDNEKVVGFEASSRNITARMRFQQELKRSQDRLNSFINSATDIIVLLDSNLYIVEVNEAGIRYWEKTRSEIVGENILDVDPQIIEVNKLDILRTVIETGAPQVIEALLSNEDKTNKHLTLKVFKVGDGLGLIASDTCDLRSYEKELQENEKKLQILVEHIPDVFYISDTQGSKIFMSPNIIKMSGFTAEEMTKNDPMLWSSLIYEEDQGRTHQALKAYLEQEQPYNVEYRIQRRDGTWIWVLDKATQKYELDGKTYFDGKLSDITEQKIMEKGLKGYTQHLESMVQDLKVYSAQLEEIVKERNRLLVDSERTIAAGQVASMVGHDLRGPLQTINNALFLMQKNPEKQEEFIKTIKGSVLYAVKMLEDLRNATRDTPLDLEENSLVNLIEIIVKELSIPEHIELEVNLGEDLEQVNLDFIKIRRVLDNLIRNAFEAMKNPGKVTVNAYRMDKDLVIEVEDTGQGIPEDFLPNMFKTFKTTKKRGLGLGLAYCKKAVQAHGGTITVESEVGVGTKFTISIPQDRTTRTLINTDIHLSNINPSSQTQ